MAKKNNKTNTAAIPPTMPLMGDPMSMQGGMPHMSAGMMPPPMGAMPHMSAGMMPMNTIGVPMTEPGKKGKKGKGAPPPIMDPTMMPGLTAEQMTQMQLEEAIKESQNPSARLKKLRSPLSVKSCLLNLLFMIILTLVLAFIIAGFFYVDKFSFPVVFNNMFEEFGIYKFFGETIPGWFTKTPEEAAEFFKMI